MCAGGWRLARHRDLAAIAAVPRGNTMSPPQLARDAPVVNVLHPVQVDGLVIVGREADVSLRDRFRGGLRHAHAAGARLLVDGDEPLRGEPRLDHGLAAVALADRN